MTPVRPKYKHTVTTEVKLECNNTWISELKVQKISTSLNNEELTFICPVCHKEHKSVRITIN